MTLTFPEEWDIHLVKQTDSPSLNNLEIRERIINTIGTYRLSELVKGKKFIAILIDDIQRPTPVKYIMPFILDELHYSGIIKDQIIIVMATACHRSATKEDFIKKLGEDIVKKYKVLSHNCTKNLIYLGKTSKGTPIYVNEYVMRCDMKIGVSGVYPHECAGFGGGDKIIHPGICGKETARYLHTHLKGVQRGNILNNEFRADMGEIAEKVGLDFIVNVILNQNREIIEIFCGHRVIAYKEAIKFAKRFYGVKPINDADIIITNIYPFDTSLHFISKGLWPFKYEKKGSSKVVIASCSEGLGYHELSLASLSGWSRFVRRVKALSRYDIYRFFFGVPNRELEFFLFSWNIEESSLKRIFKRAKLFNTWESLTKVLTVRHKKKPVKVAIYPCAPLQIPSDSESLCDNFI